MTPAQSTSSWFLQLQEIIFAHAMLKMPKISIGPIFWTFFKKSGPRV